MHGPVATALPLLPCGPRPPPHRWIQRTGRARPGQGSPCMARPKRPARCAPRPGPASCAAPAAAAWRIKQRCAQRASGTSAPLQLRLPRLHRKYKSVRRTLSGRCTTCTSAARCRLGSSAPLGGPRPPRPRTPARLRVRAGARQIAGATRAQRRSWGEEQWCWDAGRSRAAQPGRGGRGGPCTVGPAQLGREGWAARLALRTRLEDETGVAGVHPAADGLRLQARRHRGGR